MTSSKDKCFQLLIPEACTCACRGRFYSCSCLSSINYTKQEILENGAELFSDDAVMFKDDFLSGV